MHIVVTMVKINCHPKTPFLGDFWVYFVNFHSEDDKIGFSRCDFQLLQQFLHKKWSSFISLRLNLKYNNFWGAASQKHAPFLALYHIHIFL